MRGGRSESRGGWGLTEALPPELMFLETSALTGENVEEAFLKCARTILNKIDSGEAPDCPEWERERKAGPRGPQGTSPDLSPAAPCPQASSTLRGWAQAFSTGTPPSASCGSLGAPRPWPLSPVAAETCVRSQVGAWGPGTAGVGSWQGGLRSRDRDIEKER